MTEETWCLRPLMSAPEPRSAEAARRFFIVCPPPDSKWFVEEVLIPLLAEHFASFAAQECAALEQRDHDLRANLVRAYVFEPVEQQKILDALRAEVESLKAIVYQKDVLTDTAAQANDILRQRALKAEAEVERLTSDIKAYQDTNAAQRESIVIFTERIEKAEAALAAFRGRA